MHVEYVYINILSGQAKDIFASLKARKKVRTVADGQRKAQSPFGGFRLRKLRSDTVEKDDRGRVN
jgi:hypothetical protein